MCSSTCDDDDVWKQIQAMRMRSGSHNLVFFVRPTKLSTLQSNPSDIVKKHNDLRRNVRPTASNMLEMSWSSEAAANAQKWANTCSMNHSPDSSREPWSNAIQDWYDEVQNWRYGVGSTNGRVVGHYTQVVWYRSNKVGCGVAYCPNPQYKYFYVCQYCPP
ncbi:hypothetical protein JOQ06_004293 [Pogonophryne albipinna]|uniref:SCP domain-containing protein n=1 Tax=Pogonophryne albipinna TaxID=1090488 RepID=A0AAD6APV2_9TELE|nr:hypothetical protein JOQ06_004293 [Pogonophryne albipinna]